MKKMEHSNIWNEVPTKNREEIYIGLLIQNFKTNIFNKSRILIPLLKDNNINSREFNLFKQIHFSKDRIIKYSIFLGKYCGNNSQVPSILPFLFMEDNIKEETCKLAIADISKHKFGFSRSIFVCK